MYSSAELAMLLGVPHADVVAKIAELGVRQVNGNVSHLSAAKIAKAFGLSL